MKLIEEFLVNERQVLIYLCDSSDGRPEVRQALFSRWHRNMAPTIDYQPVQITVGDQSVYGGMFLRQDFSEHEVLQRELGDRAGELILEKFGQ